MCGSLPLDALSLIVYGADRLIDCNCIHFGSRLLEMSAKNTWRQSRITNARRILHIVFFGTMHSHRVCLHMYIYSYKPYVRDMCSTHVTVLCVCVCVPGHMVRTTMTRGIRLLHFPPKFNFLDCCRFSLYDAAWQAEAGGCCCSGVSHVCETNIYGVYWYMYNI